jgi:predicted transcriptional regulator
MNKKVPHTFWRGHLKVYYILLDGAATYKELKERSGFSDNTLSLILRDLVKQGKAYKKPAEKRSQEKYMIFEVNSGQINNQLDKHSELTQSIEAIPHSLKDFSDAAGDMKDSKGIEEANFRANLLLLAAWIPDLLYNCLNDESEYVHRRIDELIDEVVRPWVHDLFEVGYVWDKIAVKACVETRDSLYLPALYECDRYTEIIKGFR